MSRKKKKRTSASNKNRKPPQPEIIPAAESADMGDETAREAALQEDAARSGDSDALDAESIISEEEAEGEAELPPEKVPKPPSKRALRKAEREAAYARTDVFRQRVPSVSSREGMRLARIRRHAARQIGTPRRNETGLPHRRHPFRSTAVLLLSLSILALTGAYFAFDVPAWQQLDISLITAAPQTGLMMDNAGEVITKIRGAENRVTVPLEAIPLHTQQAFLAAEDLRFYDHGGVDIVRLFGALVANIREGSYAQGGSTITMQLIRQSHLSTQKTIARKLEEMWLAVQLERQMSKNEILAMYLNYIYFGSGAYGIQAAAQTYFGVDVQELTLAQAASLAASIKAPSYYSPLAEEANANRRSYILSTMLAQGMISQAEHDKARAEKVAVVEQAPVSLAHGWFVDAVLDEAEQLLGMTSDQVLTGGFVIDTTLSREHQEILEDQFSRDVFPTNAADGTKVQGAAACINTQTGEVLAIVGGRSYEVRRGFNRATHLRRQPGSALKPLVVYAPAIDRFGYTPASVLKDEPTDFNGYKPRNSGYTYYGNVSIRSALASSLNVAAVALLNQIGVQAGRDYLQKVGIPLDARDANLSLALGSMTYGVSPVELAAAYAPFGNGGVFRKAHFIRKITDPAGRIIYQHREEGTRVLKATSAYLMTSVLQSVTAYGTGAKLSAAGTPVAGKTGTVNMTGGGNRDIWMAAYNSEISCAFWMGYDEPDSNHKLQSWVSGGDHTAAMARNYFQALYRDRDKPQFARPDGIVAREIDKQAIKWKGEAMLAVDLTPKNYRYTEYFAEGSQPTKKSDIWMPPRSLNSFSISHNNDGYPLLRLQPADTALYRVQRDTYGESFVLTELYGGQGETLYYTDTSAKPGVVYTYRVIPVHAELLNNGILLEGVQSVQVAQANLPSQGFWGKIRDWLREEDDEDDDAVTSMTENQTSVFWGE